MKARHIFLEILCVVFFLLFLYAATSKVFELRKFYLHLRVMPFNDSYAMPIAIALPLVEIGIAISLLIEKTRTAALWMFTTLMAIFCGYIILILSHYFGRTYPCSCGGILNSLGWTEHLIFNFAFVVLAAIAIYLQRSTKKDAVQSSAKVDAKLIGT